MQSHNGLVKLSALLRVKYDCIFFIFFIDSHVELCEMLPWVSSPGQPLSLGPGDGGPEREWGQD